MAIVKVADAASRGMCMHDYQVHKQPSQNTNLWTAAVQHKCLAACMPDCPTFLSIAHIPILIFLPSLCLQSGACGRTRLTSYMWRASIVQALVAAAVLHGPCWAHQYLMRLAVTHRSAALDVPSMPMPLWLVAQRCQERGMAQVISWAGWLQIQRGDP